jgi:uncharacterized membrane protein
MYVPSLLDLGWIWGVFMNRPGKNRNKQLDKSRPRIRITLTPLEFILEMVSLLGLVGAAYLLIRFWPDLPMVIPKHFGFSGEVDGWGDRSSLFFLPGANLFLYIMMTVVSRFPHTFNYPVRITADNAWRQYQLAVWYMALLKAQVVWLFLYLEWRIIQVALGHSSGLGTWFVVVVLVGLLLPTLIYALAARKSR